MRFKSNYVLSYETRRGFTLIELLIVISIIALLVAILLPALHKAREQAKQAVCSVHTRQYSLALAAYQSEFDGALPYFMDYYPDNPGNGFPWWTAWTNRLAPYLGLAEGTQLNSYNVWPDVRECPTGQAWIGVVYGGYYLGRDSPAAPFNYGGIGLANAGAYPPVNITRVQSPASWIAFLDVRAVFMYTPNAWPFNHDWDGDGIFDGYGQLNAYNDARPQVHDDRCNIGLVDGHVEAIDFETWLDPDNGLWTN